MPEEQGRSSINCEKNYFYYVFTQLENSSAIYDLLYQTNGNAEKKDPSVKISYVCVSMP